MNFRDCWRHPWTNISGGNAGDQTAGPMGKRQRKWKSQWMSLTVWQLWLQTPTPTPSPLTLQKVMLTQTLPYRGHYGSLYR